MIDRTAKDALLRLASQFAVVCITGPRQTGKSTLAKAAFPGKRYLSFDDRTLRELATANPIDFLLAFPNGAIIDEAQKVPDIFDAVKHHIDQGAFEPGKYILTGSNQFSLRQNMTDSLAGRAAYMKLLPFSVGELNSVNMLRNNVYEVIHKGFYPPLHDTSKSFHRIDWFNNYVDTYLDLDVKNQINHSNISTFKKFIQICAIYSGQLCSMDSIAREIGVSAPTVKQWLSILESSFIIHFLYPETQNLGKTLVKTPKLYFTDSGLLCHLLRIETPEELILHPKKGAIVETFAIGELLKNRLNGGQQPNIAFFRDLRGFEVDIVADWKRTFAIEIKSTIEAEQKLSGNARKYVALRNDNNSRGAVFYLGDLSAQINGIDYVSWKDWGVYADNE